MAVRKLWSLPFSRAYSMRFPPSTSLEVVGLAPDMLGLLLKNGYRTLRDLMPLGPVQLAQDLDIRPDQALAVLQDNRLASASWDVNRGQP